MPVRSPEQCLGRLRVLYRDAHKCDPASDALVLDWANHPEAWAEQQIRHRGWSYFAAEAVVRNCRALRRRAALAVTTTEADA
jgi:hypothetical protein